MSSTAENNPQPLRKIRSFIRRQGRLTQGQQLALTNHWDFYGLNPELEFDAIKVFGRRAPVCVEIGFGDGECLLNLASRHPEKDFIGIEVHRPGVGHLMLRLTQLGLTNVRIYCHDAVDVLAGCFSDRSLSAVHLFFPDPWPKKKHHKRRIVQPEFIDLLSRKLEAHGYFHAATDWEHYADAMLQTFSTRRDFVNASPQNGYSEKPDYRPLTKFEQRGLRLGHGVWDLIFTKA